MWKGASRDAGSCDLPTAALPASGSRGLRRGARRTLSRPPSLRGGVGSPVSTSSVSPRTWFVRECDKNCGTDAENPNNRSCPSRKPTPRPRDAPGGGAVGRACADAIRPSLVSRRDLPGAPAGGEGPRRALARDRPHARRAARAGRPPVDQPPRRNRSHDRPAHRGPGARAGETPPALARAGAGPRRAGLRRIPQAEGLLRRASRPARVPPGAPAHVRGDPRRRPLGRGAAGEGVRRCAEAQGAQGHPRALRREPGGRAVSSTPPPCCAGRSGPRRRIRAERCSWSSTTRI